MGSPLQDQLAGRPGLGDRVSARTTACGPTQLAVPGEGSQEVPGLGARRLSAGQLRGPATSRFTEPFSEFNRISK